jgi:hypothetical protein
MLDIISFIGHEAYTLRFGCALNIIVNCECVGAQLAKDRVQLVVSFSGKQSSEHGEAPSYPMI